MRKFANSVPVFKKEFMKNVKSFKELFLLSQEKNIYFGIFPEGNLNKEDRLKEFKSGAAYFSYKTKIPIIPVYIHNILKGPTEKRWIGRNRVIEGVISLIINSFRKINIFIGNPIDPMTKGIIEDFKSLADKKTYKQIVENINKALEEEFFDLKQQADLLFGNTANDEGEEECEEEEEDYSIFSP